MLDGMSDSIQRSSIENLHSREVDRQSPTGLIFLISTLVTVCTVRVGEHNFNIIIKIIKFI